MLAAKPFRNSDNQTDQANPISEPVGGIPQANRQIATILLAHYARARKDTRMKDAEQLEIKIPVPWSSEPVGIVCTGWRCIFVVAVIAAAAGIMVALLN
jgi:hypothetical protein